MTQAIDNSTTRSLELAMDGVMLRQQTIATNMANAHTPGYVPVSVEFERSLRAAVDQMGSAGGDPGAALQPVFKPQIDPVTGAPASVRLDQEMAAMSQSVVQYEVLARSLSRELGLLSMAVTEGKR